MAAVARRGGGGGGDATATEEWRLCADWLLRCLADYPDILQQASAVLDAPGATVVDLLNCLKDGVLLCHILPALSCQQIQLDSLPGFKIATLNSAFAFRQNLSAFLDQCRNEFGVAPSDLFSPDDVLGQENVSAIIRALSLLSTSPRAAKSGIPSFEVGGESATSDYASGYCSLLATATNNMTLDTDRCEYGDVAAERVYESIMQRRPSAAAGSQTRQQQDQDQAAAAAAAAVTPKEMCMRELVSTEKAYVDTLRLLVEDVMRPLKEPNSSWTPVEVDEIFEHLPELLTMHRKLLREMEVATQLRGAKPLPAVLIGFREPLLIYGNYCAHMQAAVKLLEDLCRSDRRRQDELQRHLEASRAQFKLVEYLTVPMQRVLRYHLLLNSLIKFDKKQGGSEQETLQEAHDAMCDVATYVNEVKRDTEMRALIDQIQTQVNALDMPGNLRLSDYGRLELDDDLRVANDPAKPLAGGKLRFCFLWTRMFMLTKPRPGLTFKAAFAVKPTLTIKEVETNASAGSGGASRAASNAAASDAKWTWAFTVSEHAAGGGGGSSKENQQQVHFVFLAKTKEARQRWLDAFQRAKDDVAPPNYNAHGHHFERRTLEPPAYCSVCAKLIHGCFFQGYKCRKTGLTVHKQCIPSGPFQLPDRNHSGGGGGGASRPQSMMSAPRTPAPHQVARRDTISYVAPLPPDSPRAAAPAKSPRSASTLAQDPDGQQQQSSLPSRAAPVPLVGPSPSWQDYYVGTMAREEARDALMQRPSGTFLVRESQGSGDYAISLRYGDTVKHMRVQRTTEGYRLGETRFFSTVQELVLFYCSNSLRECFRELDGCLQAPYRARQTSRRSSNVLGWATVLRDYAAPPSVGHVSLSAGEIVAVLSQDDQLWCGRKLNGQVGLFPADVVGPLSSSPIE